MRCLHILPMNKLSGAEKLVLILCKNMKTYEPIVVCGGDKLKYTFEKEKIKSYSVNFNNKNIIKVTNELKNIIQKNNIRIVHAHDNNASVSVYITKLLYKLDIKVISHIHNCYPWLEGKTLSKKIDSFFRKRYDYNIACGRLVYDYYLKNTNYININNITYLSNAIDVDKIKRYRYDNVDEIYKEFNISKDEIIFGFIGRLSEQKGIIPFIKELANYKDKFNDSKFLLIGSGEQELEVKELLKKYNLEKLVILTGYQDNIYKFYPIIDIFFLPSLYEGLPMVILEAMSFKKAIVSMNVGSINEVIVNEENGMIVEKGNYKQFIESMINIKSNKRLANIYGKKSFDEIDKNHNIKKYAEEISKLYDNILNK